MCVCVGGGGVGGGVGGTGACVSQFEYAVHFWNPY